MAKSENHWTKTFQIRIVHFVSGYTKLFIFQLIHLHAEDKKKLAATEKKKTNAEENEW